MVPTPSVRELALTYGFHESRVHVTGIPVNPAIARTERPPREVRASLGMDPDRLTVLAVGSRRVEHLKEALHVVNHFGYPLQLIAVTGKDAEMYADLQSIEWHIPAHVYEFSTNMTDLMQASDILICKAGGLIVTEALACGLPLILVDVIPGQETGNASFVVDQGAGDLAFTGTQVLETLAHWTANDGQLLAERSANARRAGKPEAALDVARILWKAAQIGPQPSQPAGRLSLIRLLRKNKIRWQWEDDSQDSVDSQKF
jgi:1,2-diacylglycerol 3-beta-galactosyltransferase